MTDQQWRKKLATPALRRMGLAGGILAFAAGLSALIIVTGPDGEAEDQVEKAWPVSIVRAAPAELHPMFATYGRVEARTQAQLRANVRSTVEEVLVREGEWVQQGDLLIRLREDEIKLRLRDAQAEEVQQKAALDSIEREFSNLRGNSAHFKKLYELSQGKLARQRTLAERKMIPQSLFEDAVEQAARDSLEYQAHLSALTDFPNRITQQRAQVEKAQVLVEQSRIDLAKIEIRAPFTGPVLAVEANLGDFTQVGVALVTIAEAVSFEVRAAIPNQYTQRIRAHLARGNPITARIDQTDRAPDHLSLSRIARNVRTGQGSLDAFFAFDPDQLRTGNIPDLGRVLNLNTVLPPEPGLVALPTQAIYENNRIYTIRDSRLLAVNVERVGEFQDTDGSYKILVRGTSLTNESDVVTTQLPKAITGLLVEPILPISDTDREETAPGGTHQTAPTGAIVSACDQALLSAAAPSGCTTIHGFTTIVQRRASLSCQRLACSSLT